MNKLGLILVPAKIGHSAGIGPRVFLSSRLDAFLSGPASIEARSTDSLPGPSGTPDAARDTYDVSVWDSIAMFSYAARHRGPTDLEKVTYTQEVDGQTIMLAGIHEEDGVTLMFADETSDH